MEVPAALYNYFANSFGSAQMRKNATKLIKMLNRARSIGDIFKHFTTNEWIFSTANLALIERNLTNDERIIFDLDVRKIEW